MSALLLGGDFFKEGQSLEEQGPILGLLSNAFKMGNPPINSIAESAVEIYLDCNADNREAFLNLCLDLVCFPQIVPGPPCCCCLADWAIMVWPVL